jgi:hypothetical protein
MTKNFAFDASTPRTCRRRVASAGGMRPEWGWGCQNRTVSPAASVTSLRVFVSLLPVSGSNRET